MTKHLGGLDNRRTISVTYDLKVYILNNTLLYVDHKYLTQNKNNHTHIKLDPLMKE